MERERLKTIYNRKIEECLYLYKNKEEYEFIKYLIFVIKIQLISLIKFWKTADNYLTEEYMKILIESLKYVCILQDKMGIIKEIKVEEIFHDKFRRFISEINLENKRKNFVDSYFEYSEIEEEFFISNEAIMLASELLKRKYIKIFKGFSYNYIFSIVYDGVKKYYTMFEREILTIKEEIN